MATGQAVDDWKTVDDWEDVKSSVTDTARAHLAANASKDESGRWTPSPGGSDITATADTRDTEKPAEKEFRANHPTLQNLGDMATKVNEAIDPTKISTGIAKSAGNTLNSVIPGDRPNLTEALKPANPGEHVGKVVGDAAQFVAGDAAAGKLVSYIPLVTKSPLMARMLAGALSGGAVTKAQGGSNAEAGVNAAAGGLLPMIFEGGGRLLNHLGEKFETSLIRPNLADMANGYKAETLKKYGLLKMSLKDTLEATHQKIASLATQLRDMTQSAPSRVNLSDVIDETEKNLLSRANALKAPADEAKHVKNAIAEYREWANNLPGGAELTVDEAQTAKRAVGLKGAWQYNKSAADNGMEKVSNDVYGRLKSAIEKATPPELQGVNRQLGELMPVEQAILRRIPVAMRNDPLRLSDMMLLATGHPVGAVAHMASRTIAGANATGALGRGLTAAGQPVTKALQSVVSH